MKEIIKTSSDLFEKVVVLDAIYQRKLGLNLTKIDYR